MQARGRKRNRETLKQHMVSMLCKNVQQQAALVPHCKYLVVVAETKNEKEKTGGLGQALHRNQPNSS